MKKETMRKNLINERHNSMPDFLLPVTEAFYLTR